MEKIEFLTTEKRKQYLKQNVNGRSGQGDTQCPSSVVRDFLLSHIKNSTPLK